MSWLNFNESLNSLKGQLTNFATGVLNEEGVNSETSIVGDSQNEDGDAQESFTNIELQGLTRDGEQETESVWGWDSPKESYTTNYTSKDEVIHNLQKKISALENDKRELSISLEQLDLDCQQTTDKLVTLKDHLQIEYDYLKTDFENLKQEFTSVLNENMAKTNEIELLKDQKHKKLLKLQEENIILNKQLMVSLKEVESKNELVEKFNNLQAQCDGHLESLISEKLISEELQKLYSDLEDVNASLMEKLRKYNMEPDCLLEEHEAINLQATTTSLEYDELMIENQELCEKNVSLKNENELLKTNYESCTDQVTELIEALEKAHKNYESQILANHELKTKMQDFEVNDNSLCQDNKKFNSECKQLKFEVDTLNACISKLTSDHDILFLNYQDLQKVNDMLRNDNKQLKLTNISLEKDKDNLNTFGQQDLHEKCFSIIHNKIQKILHPEEVSQSIDDHTEVSEYAAKFDLELNKLSCFKTKSDVLEKQIAELTQFKNTMVAEKNQEIEKLLKNSEILSQEVINKTESLKYAEDECAELMKNNDLLITELNSYRKSNLQTISESHEDNLLQLEIQLENANKRIQALECLVIELESPRCDNLELELESRLSITRLELEQSNEKFSELLSLYNKTNEDGLLMKTALEKTKSDFENIEYKCTELTINFDTLKEEHEQLKTKHSDLLDLYKTWENKIALLEDSEHDLKQKLRLEIENNRNKEVQIQNFIERLQNSKVSETSWKLQVDTLNKELQTITDAKQILEVKYEACLIEFEKRKDEDVKEKTSQLMSKIIILEEQLKELTISRDDLINLVRTKHEENVKYHEEIQRLNQLLSIEIEKAKSLEQQLNDLYVDNISQEEIAQKNDDLEKIRDQNNFLKEKCEILAHNLLQEQSNLQKVMQERQLVIDREVQSVKELERLRQHLVDMEDSYTQELLQAEKTNKDMLMKVNEIEQREKDSNSIYTSVNIRANQQVETLQTQIQLVTNQREELRAVISDLEDKENKQAAALTNLQLVLEQFQRDKEKDVQQETERIRRQIGIEKHIQEELKKEIGGLKLQLEESKQGLQAASRLADQLEKSKQMVHSHNEEILKLQEQLQATENKCQELTGSTDSKVDRSLIKNLVLGYITSNSNDQRQILKVIATVLDFNKKENEKANLNQSSQGSWLSTILQPQNLNPSQDANHQSLSEAFVRFLENESKPKVAPNLLMATQQAKDNLNMGNDKPRESPHSLLEVVLPTFDDFGSSRSSSSILKGVLKNNT